MSYRLVFLRHAEDDFDRAIDWYLAQAPHEVERLLASVDAALLSILRNPLLPRVVYHELRAVKTATFPYHFWYRVLDEIELVEVVAVLHSAQDLAQLEER